MTAEKENKILRQIILDLLKYSDGCNACEKKGQHPVACECMNDKECIEHMLTLYAPQEQTCEHLYQDY